MRLVTYDPKTIKENIEDLVEIDFGILIRPVYTVRDISVLKVTEKQFKTLHNTVRLADVGRMNTCNEVYVLKQDVELAVERFKSKRIEQLEQEIAHLKEKVAYTKTIRRKEG